ncbi:hypothetical protein BY996DRAFT_655400 [Phakopsora pachyrhizi]|nr:hypothetical protein BY996DRAFT_655400 [Phakopsora pachyrhizi]
MSFPIQSGSSSAVDRGVLLKQEIKPKPEAEWVKWLPGQVTLNMEFNRDPSYRTKNPPPYELMPTANDEVDPLCISDSLTNALTSLPTVTPRYHLSDDDDDDDEVSMRQIWGTFKDWNFPIRTDEPRGFIYGPFHPTTKKRIERDRAIKAAARADEDSASIKENETTPKAEEGLASMAVTEEVKEIETVEPRAKEWFAKFGYDIQLNCNYRTKRIIPILRLPQPQEQSKSSTESGPSSDLLPPGTMRRAKIRVKHNKRTYTTDLYRVSEPTKKRLTNEFVKVKVLSDVTNQVTNQERTRKSRIRLCTSSQLNQSKTKNKKLYTSQL